MPIRLSDLPPNAPPVVIVLTRDVVNTDPDRRVKNNVFCAPVIPEGTRLRMVYHATDLVRMQAPRIGFYVTRTQAAEGGSYGTCLTTPDTEQARRILDAAEFEPRNSVGHILDVYEFVSAKLVLEQLVADGKVSLDDVEAAVRRCDEAEEPTPGGK